MRYPTRLPTSQPLCGLTALLLTGCEGPQSALAPAGRDAEQIAALATWLVAGLLVIWAATVLLFVYAAYRPRAGVPANTAAPSDPLPADPNGDPRAARAVIVIGGVVVPAVVLTALLVRGLSLMPDLLDPGAEGGLRIDVLGEQWWWRVEYALPDGRRVEVANEIRLPLGRRTPLYLASADVIHSFWVPSLAGKLDMIPGRTNRLGLEPTRTGVFRGACAEYCGASHTEMALYAMVLEPGDFELWLARELEPARAAADPLTQRGAEVFLENGCGACHAVRGTDAAGSVGPDLTHVGGRHSLAAGLLPNDAPAFATWITRASHIKPGVYMPAFGMLDESDLRALAAWLDGLE